MNLKLSKAEIFYCMCEGLVAGAVGVFFLICLGMVSCKSIKKTTVRSVDTLITLSTIKVPFDTTLVLAARQLTLLAPVQVIAGVAQMPAQTIHKDGVTTTATIRDGKLQVETSVGDSALRVKGSTEAQVPLTTIRERETVTITEKPSLLQRIWNGIRNFLLEIVVIAVIVFVVAAFLKRS